MHSRIKSNDYDYLFIDNTQLIIGYVWGSGNIGKVAAISPVTKVKLKLERVV